MYSVGDYLEIYKVDKTFRFFGPDSLDKEKSDPNMPSMAVPVADVGSANWIVARVFIQSMEAIHGVIVGRKINLKELALLAHKAKELLLECERVYMDFLQQYEKSIKSIDSGIKRSGNVFLGVPTVNGLSEISSTFLMAAKNTLQVEAQIVNEFFQTNFYGPRFDFVLRWAKDHHLAKNTDFIEFLAKSQDFTKYIVDMRNAQEHPKKEKELIVSNFRLQPHHKIAAPTWHITGGESADVGVDMKDILDGLVAFHEGLFFHCLMLNMDSKFTYRVVGIPDEQIDKICPIRLKMEVCLPHG